jgi:hypothetical protein
MKQLTSTSIAAPANLHAPWSKKRRPLQTYSVAHGGGAALQTLIDPNDAANVAGPGLVGIKTGLSRYAKVRAARLLKTKEITF